ncbi:MAG TPA: SDR family oxidoreductase [Candidatus Aerophobetes bacterium]|uniref:SDR family oxidoreductase n=1 Tax=Aerophobetes bacterium TaxID=2030807 RepID=A0A662DFG2_UNCAE|nr:MAG: short-chain dehydrogenase [Candidatus Aerophobetes bacterium]HDN84741.1 SDR family oxidoreductase [Candidatus Aerophobetes bacterium]
MRFKDKVVLITGAAQGIGEATAIAFARERARVALADLNLDGVLQVKEKIDKIGGETLALKVDISNPAMVNEMMKKTVDHFGRLDILVNNAGIIARGVIEDVTDEMLDKVLSVNFKGVFYCCRAAVPIMKKQKYGKIVNVSSITAKRGDNTTAPCYGASKGAILTLTRSLARQLGPFGINVNAVAPHAIDTPMMKYWDEKKRKAVIESLPVRRMGKPEDVAHAILFLSSDEAGFITGETLNLNGGYLMD